MSARAHLREGVARLAGAGIEGPARDARLLLAHAMGVDATRLSLHLEDVLEGEALARWNAAIEARAARRPVAQIIGRRAFWGLEFEVSAATLDPRPDTEVLVEHALAQPFTRILDLGTGTGCILLSCLYDTPAASGIGLDLSPEALEVAGRNAERLGLAGRARLVQSDWFAAVAGERFDLIVSNPPYIAADEMAGLAPEVRDWEPHLALTPGGDGLEPYRIISAAAPAHLHPGGRILFEIGPSQGAQVSAMLSAAGFKQVQVIQDWDGRDRVVTGNWPV